MLARSHLVFHAAIDILKIVSTALSYFDISSLNLRIGTQFSKSLMNELKDKTDSCLSYWGIMDEKMAGWIRNDR